MSVLSAQWTASSTCQGGPASVYFGNGSSPFYDFVNQEYAIGSCGNYVHRESLQCCYQSIDLAGSNGVRSGYHTPSNAFDISLLPKSMNTMQYCSITPETQFDSYNKLLLLPDACIDDKYRCSATGLSLYNGTGCSSLLATYPLGQTVTTLFGKAKAELITISGAKDTFIWTAITPSALLVPNFAKLESIEVTALLLYIVSFLAAGWTLVFYIRRYFSTSKRFMLYKLVQHLFWTLLVAAKFLYWTLLFPDIQSFALYSEVMQALFNLATLLTVLHSAIFLNKYADFSKNVTNPLQSKINEWNQLGLYWILFLFVYDMIPAAISVRPILMHFKREKQISNLGMFVFLFREEPLLMLTFVAQLPVIVLHVVFSILRSGTVFGSDRTFLAMESVFVFLLLLHALLAVLFLERAKEENSTLVIRFGKTD
ncbi:hypothetical protein EDD86DRAFT_249057 [Gorgonomyces haynaldii]|nr:hypothetical protein EDD86DRAFT_249057 [Gorgonomyces haynaldii]